MDWMTVSSNWATYVPVLQTRWPDIAENDLLTVDGDRARLVTLVAQATDQTQTEAADSVAEWLSGAEPADAVMAPERDSARIRQSRKDIPDGETPLDDDAAFGDAHTADTPLGRTG